MDKKSLLLFTYDRPMREEIVDYLHHRLLTVIDQESFNIHLQDLPLILEELLLRKLKLQDYGENQFCNNLANGILKKQNHGNMPMTQHGHTPNKVIAKLLKHIGKKCYQK